MTLQEEWRLYSALVFPHGMTAAQSRDLHMTFFAGARVALEAMDAASNCADTPEAETAAAEGLESMLKEAREHARQIVTAAKARMEQRKAQEN